VTRTVLIDCLNCFHSPNPSRQLALPSAKPFLILGLVLLMGCLQLGVYSVSWAGPFAGPFEGSPFRPKFTHKIVQPPPRPRPTEQVLNTDRWHRVFQSHKESVYLDQTSVRRCDRVVGVSSLRSCRDVKNGFAYWKRVVMPKSSKPIQIETGVVDCARREVNFYPLRPNTANAFIFQALCKK
jgi:hypothetical protein